MIEDNPHIQTLTGRYVPLLNPTVKDIDIEDIVGPSSLIPRFTGQTAHDGEPTAWTIGQHGLLVRHIAQTMLGATLQTQLACLIHDFHEAYVNDDSSPKKRALIELCGFDPIKKITVKFDKAISEKFGLPYPWPASMARMVKEADLLALMTEQANFMPQIDKNDRMHWAGLPDPLRHYKLVPWPAYMIRNVLRDQINNLTLRIARAH